MPIYEYECLDQKHRFEVIQKFSDPHVTHCTVCGGAVQRLLSSPAIQFKGSGWYITDYARKDSGSSGESNSSKSTSTDKPASSDSAKPAAEASTTSTTSETKTSTEKS